MREEMGAEKTADGTTAAAAATGAEDDTVSGGGGGHSEETISGCCFIEEAPPGHILADFFSVYARHKGASLFSIAAI